MSKAVDPNARDARTPGRLDPPAAAARRRYALDRIVEDLVGWGCPLEHAEPRAAQLLDRVLDAGYALPAAVADVPAPRGHGSSEAGRTRARLLWTHRRSVDELVDLDRSGRPARIGARCACGAWAGPPRATHDLAGTDHDRHLAAMLVVGGVATPQEQANARPTRPLGEDQQASGCNDLPPTNSDAHSGAQRAAR